MSGRALGDRLVPVWRVEDNATVLRGLALPFGPPGAIVLGPEGSWVQELMDPESIARIENLPLPLFVSHDRDRPPAGIVRTAAVMADGVGIEAKLVGSDDELEGWRRRFRHGLFTALSVGFTRDKKREVFERPERAGGLPIIRPRGVRIVELSLVQWPAYERAGITSLSVRSAENQRRHEESQELVSWFAARRRDQKPQ